MSRSVKAARAAADELRDTADTALAEQISRTSKEVESAISNRLGRMMEIVRKGGGMNAETRFAGVNEDEIMTYIPDNRTLAGAGPILLGLLLLVVLPGSFKVLSLAFFAFGAFLFFVGYVLKGKVDVPDGFEGVLCRYGNPVPGYKSKSGRNRLLRFGEFMPYLVSKRDLVVEASNANFTRDYATIGLDKQFVVEVENPAKFVMATSPAGVMKIINLYAQYIALRMITSIRDARVKFTGRDRLDNVVEALNGYLREEYGVRVKRATMPQATNDTLDDLEAVRTNLNRIDAEQENQRVQLEAAIKQVESDMRTQSKVARNTALELEQTQVTLDTSISESVNSMRQEWMIRARRQLDEAISGLQRELAEFKAAVVKAKATRASFNGLQADLDLRKAGIKRMVVQRMIPKRVDVMNVDGVGAGLGMSMGNEMLRRVLTAGNSGQQSAA